MEFLSLFLLPKGVTGDAYVELPITTIEHGVEITRAYGLHNLDDAMISQYHPHLVGSGNPNQEHMSWGELQAAAFPVEVV